MGMFLVHKALTQSYIDLGIGCEIAFENKDFEPKKDKIFVVLTLIPNVSESLGKGISDIDEGTGIYQVSFYAPSGTSVGKVLPLVDRVLGFYKHNRRLSHQDQIVTIINSGRNAGRNEDGWWIVDCTINFKTDIKRI